MRPPKAKKVSLFLLVLLIVSAIDSIRNLPATALFGSSLIFFFLFSAIVFLIPVSLVAAEFSASMPEKGGVYHWTAKAFGDKVGMLSIWLQWINTMVWYPTILSFIVGTAAYFFDPSLIEDKRYLLSGIFLVFWGLTFLNLFGVEFSAKINSFCALIGTLLPMVLLIFLGFFWLSMDHPSQITFSWKMLFPTLATSSNWVSLTAIIASFLGMELAGVHVNEMKDPKRNFPLALGYSVVLLMSTMLLGSLAIAFVLPAEKINLVAGVMQVFTDFFQAFHMPWGSSILALFIVIGSLGGMINWLISPAKGLLHAAEYGFLPPFFTKRNSYGVASRVLIAQAILVSLFCLVFFLVPNVNAFYWFLTGLSTDLYILMYILMFFSALKLRRKKGKNAANLLIPGKRYGIGGVVLLGLLGCFITLVVSFFPPEHIEVCPLKYAGMMVGGNICMVLPVFAFYRYQRRRKKKMSPEVLPGRPPGL